MREAPTAASARGATDPASRPNPSDFVAHPVLNDIYFAFDRYDIDRTAAVVLNAHVGWLKLNPGYALLIEGHADERGTNEYNVALGERRARAVMNYLTARGVTSSRVTIISYGEDRRACGEHTEACWAQNRRAHFLVKAQ